MTKIVASFTLDSETDQDILDWLKRQPKGDRSAAVRRAIRDHLGRSGVTLGDVYQAVRDLERKLQTGATGMAPVAPHDPWDEPPEAAAALDALAHL